MLNPCVLIPSYNESKTIGGIVRALKARGLKSYVVDDGSTDGTGAIAAREGSSVIRHRTNAGKGASLRDGMAAALEDTGCDSLIIMDGDGQHRVEDIDVFLRKSEATNADMVIGNRMDETSSMPYMRIAVNKLMSGILSKISGCEIPDSQCGFRLIKRHVLEAIRLESSNYEVESEMIIETARRGFKIASVPIETIYRGSLSRINPVVDTLRFIAFLLKIGTHPIFPKAAKGEK